MKIRSPLPLLPCLALAASAAVFAQARVIKCVDPRTGATTFSNMACEGGATGAGLPREKTAVERQAERQAAEQARRQQEARAKRERFEADIRAAQEPAPATKP